MSRPASPRASRSKPKPTADSVAERLLAKLEKAGPRGVKDFRLPASEAPLLEEGLALVRERVRLVRIARGSELRWAIALPPPEPAAILEAVRATANRGATLTALAKALAHPKEDLEAPLSALVEAGQVIARRSGATTKYLAAPSLASVMEHVRALLAADPDRLFKDAEIEQATDSQARSLAAEALSWLRAEGAALRLHHTQRGKRTDYWLAVRPAATRGAAAEPEPASAAAAPTGPAPAAAAGPATSAAVRAAYARLRDRTGLSFVPIPDLQQESGVPLPALKQWLLDGCARGAVLATGTNLSVVDGARRDAAIDWMGERCLLVRFVEAPDQPE